MGDKSIRAAQLISPFGPGAVVDLGSESFVCTDISRWPESECPVLPDNALQRALMADIRRPPSAEQHGAVPFSRFPRWMFCPSCRRLYNYSHADDERNEFKQPMCSGGECVETALVPMRFVAACEHGHLQDVDWYRWCHRNTQIPENGQCSRQTAKMTFETSGASGGDFNAMAIVCKSCGQRNTFEGLTNRPYPFSCLGRQPWESHKMSTCTAIPRVFPRAASNIYYVATRSALDIGSGASESGQDPQKALRSWLVAHPRIIGLRSVLVAIPNWQQMPELFSDIINSGVDEFGLNEEDVRGAVIDVLSGENINNAEDKTSFDKSQHSFLISEWPYLARPSGIQSENLKTSVQFLHGAWPAEYSRPFEQITLIERLREVRALIGFKRVKPDNTATEVPVDLGAGLNWLPGVETFGEGIFLKLSESYVSTWETLVAPAISDSLKHLTEACSRWGREPASVYASPRFIALHTLAHGLIRRLSFDAGYSSSSIRERIYCDTGVNAAAGILLYTSDGDTEGSLGGLVRQGNPERFLTTLQRTLADLSWCSADPVCSESEKQGIDGMNAAACHACALVSETSCTFNNSLLDRRLVIGSPDGRIPGLLNDIALQVK
ncbi:DrmB family protein [Vogesella amnigena]|uniref:DrmB family protein n=1 Tax=Vogesella amnigena TaxID=1507449 RepID=A0ABV7TRB2_9NEIS